MASNRKLDGKLSLLTVAAALVGASACVEISGADFPQYLEREEKQFTVSGTPEVTMSTFDGSIQIRPGSGSEVHLVVEKRATDKEAVETIVVDARQDGNRITIDVKAPPHVGYLHSHHRHAKLIVTLPANSDVVAKSGDGSIDAEGISGQLELRSGDGSIRGRRLEGDLLVHTGDGSIRLEGVKGTLRATTGDGSVRVMADAGPSGNWDISTGDGSVVLTLPENFNADIDAHTGDGRVHLRDMSLTNVTGEINRRTLRGQLGSGGNTVRVRSGDGSITFRRLDGELSTTLPAERP